MLNIVTFNNGVLDVALSPPAGRLVVVLRDSTKGILDHSTLLSRLLL